MMKVVKKFHHCRGLTFILEGTSGGGVWVITKNNFCKSAEKMAKNRSRVAKGKKKTLRKSLKNLAQPEPHQSESCSFYVPLAKQNPFFKTRTRSTQESTQERAQSQLDFFLIFVGGSPPRPYLLFFKFTKSFNHTLFYKNIVFGDPC